ncbi:hypothetical protein [Pseudoalteromonas luteoviolacea]|uniref:Uncharacterized protein n=1 Tax=Pseudoalteromonas luteoviolacea S4060-1 TaxID=1365257 RepID=A0A167IMJ3_9GAMM|nr:hypothetical protein [Pseudoalteromonas luteoviolacea]KZN59725.1 hypothetical protein N478_08380 [Pseudoalteromonas luteoviolacea S4060-1]
MKQFFYSPVFAGLAIFLSGCGDSSNDNKPQVRIAEKPTLSFTAQQFTRCGIKDYAGTTVIFHDETGQAIATFEAHNTAQFTQEIPTGAKHVSILGENAVFETEKITGVITALDISKGAKLSNVMFYDLTDSCECRSVTADFTALKATHSDFYIFDSNLNPLSDYHDELKACQNKRSAFYAIKLPGYEDVLATVSDISADDNEIIFSGSDFSHEGVKLDINALPLDSRYTVRGVGESDQVIYSQSSSVSASDEQVYTFPSITNENYISIAKSGIEELDNLSFYVVSGSVAKVDETGIVTGISLPNQSMGMLETVSNIFGRGTLEYDFSKLDSRLRVAHWRFEYQWIDSDVNRVDWEVQGALQATIPKLSFGDILTVPEDRHTESVKVVISGHEGAPLDLKEYRASINGNTDFTHSDKYHFVRIEATNVVTH